MKRNGRWRARYRGPDRKQYSKTFDRKLDAQRWLDEKTAEMHRGTWLDPKAGRITFAEWWATYNARAPKRASTRNRDQGAADKWLLPYLGPVELAQISKSMVRQVVSRMEESGLAPSTIRTYYGVLQGAMTAAVEDDLISRSPCPRAKTLGLTTQRRRDPRFLSMEELYRLADAIGDDYRAMVLLSGVVGLRFGECAALRRSRVDFFRSTVSVEETANAVGGHIVVGPPKTANSIRTVPIPQLVADELRQHIARRQEREGILEPGALVFTSPQGATLRRKHFRSRTWKPAVKAAGFPDLTFHGLRHSAAGFLIAADAHPRVIMRRMGHSSIRTTMDDYGSLLQEVDDQVTDRLDAMFEQRAEDSV